MAAIRDSTATSRERSRCSHDRQAPGETEGYRDLTGAVTILPRPAKRAATPGQYRDLTGAVTLLPRPAKRAATPGQYRDLTGAVPLLT